MYSKYFTRKWVVSSLSISYLLYRVRARRLRLDCPPPSRCLWAVCLSASRWASKSSPAPFVKTPYFWIRFFLRYLRFITTLFALSRLVIWSRISLVENIITLARFFSWLIVLIIEAGDELFYRYTRSRTNVDWALSLRTLLGVRAHNSASARIGRVGVGVRSCISSCDRTIFLPIV
jgi:hypothetical protein